ncbi:ABC transporter ATP-binding protein [Marinobacterium jannaschii]|uniref:ABC transporter ATP-binding protein n=1 Tax=Marinobacterium jannaschii TaxID=64970 RepID=UPI000485F1E4|nr:ATP-binding cassette domain-containing protein [Marinobacterium jannaschii]
MNLINTIDLAVYAGEVQLLQPLSLKLTAGERLTILGQTGSGKSLLAQAIMGNLPDSLRSSGEIELFGKPSCLKSRRALWGRQLSMLPQEPWNALSPLMSAANQLAETYRLVAGQKRAQAADSAAEVLASHGLSASLDKRVDQLSGGMAQRVAIACAMAGGAPVLLADEPTKGLDVSRRDHVVLQLLNQSAKGALVTITHDVAVARQIGGRIMVMKEGELVEQGDAGVVLEAPQHPYTRSLIAADPVKWPGRSGPEIEQGRTLVQADGLAIGRGGKALVSDLNFSVHAGEVVGVVGDSGCGKSTLGDTLLGLAAPVAGVVEQLVEVPKHRWQKLYQDPTAAVSHAVPLRTLLMDLVKLHHVDSARIAPLMQRLGLGHELLDRTASQVSGGELQRFCLLRALLLDPVFLFADEPTSRLDPITTREVSQLLVEVAREQGCGVMLVSHDPALIEKRCDRVIRL